jgi:hypothetical protein
VGGVAFQNSLDTLCEINSWCPQRLLLPPLLLYACIGLGSVQVFRAVINCNLDPFPPHSLGSPLIYLTESVYEGVL